VLLHQRPATTGLRFRSTRDGNAFWGAVLSFFSQDIVNEETYARSLSAYETIPNKYCLKLCRLLALVRTLVEADDVMLDHELEEEEIQQFFTNLAEEWSIVLDQNDDTLRLGVNEGKWYVDWAQSLTPTAEGTSATAAEICTLSEQAPALSREGLYAMLGSHKAWIEREMSGMGMDITVSFLPSQSDGSEETSEAESDMSGSDADNSDTSA
jgi:hypothetical protein